MKGQRKRMRKAILAEMTSTRPWMEIVTMLEAKGIPLNLILHEANEFGKRRSLRGARRNENVKTVATERAGESPTEAAQPPIKN
jgi:hypothetical protein